MILTKTDSTLFQEPSSSNEPLSERSLCVKEIYPKKPVTVYYDVTRLISRREKPFATGIDRVDLEYLKQHMAQPNIDLRCIALTDDKIQEIQEDVIKKYLEDLSKVWSGHTIDQRPADVLKINGNLPTSRFRRFKLKHFGNLRFDQDLFSKKESYGKYYFNASHIGILSLRNDICDSFLKRFQGRVIAYIHDLIPINHPNLVTKASAKKLKCYLDNALKFNYTLLFNSRSTKQSFNDYYNVGESSYNFVIQYPILEKKLSGHVRESIHDLAKEPYFVSVGTIEPRKNHIFLLKIWEKMVHDSNDKISKLVIVGKRGWNNSETFYLLDSMKRNSTSVIEINDANDSEIDFLNKHSQAALFPSMAEGFHLSLYEAAHQSNIVLVSDIAVHQEMFYENKNISIMPINKSMWHNFLIQLMKT